MSDRAPFDEATAPALLLACGNTMRGDDRVGWLVGCAVDNHPQHPNLNVILTQQLLPEHAEAVSTASRVVFVDCSAVTAPGEVSTFSILPADMMPLNYSHSLDPASLLRLAQELYGRVPETSLAVTVGGQFFDLSESLSPEVEAALPHAVKAVHTALLN